MAGFPLLRRPRRGNICQRKCSSVCRRSQHSQQEQQVSEAQFHLSGRWRGLAEEVTPRSSTH